MKCVCLCVCKRVSDGYPQGRKRSAWPVTRAGSGDSSSWSKALLSSRAARNSSKESSQDKVKGSEVGSEGSAMYGILGQAMKSSEWGTGLPSAACKPGFTEHPYPGVGGELPTAPANGENCQRPGTGPEGWGAFGHPCPSFSLIKSEFIEMQLAFHSSSCGPSHW